RLGRVAARVPGRTAGDRWPARRRGPGDSPRRGRNRGPSLRGPDRGRTWQPDGERVRRRERARDRGARRRYLPGDRSWSWRAGDRRGRVRGSGAPRARGTSNPVWRERMTGPMPERLERWPTVGVAGARGVV